jgi:sec-independent protein translocase protein TatC
MPIAPKRMPLLDHLDELRRRLAVIAAIVILGSLGLYYWGWDIYEVIMAPVLLALGDAKPVVFGPFEAFTLRFKVALYGTLIIGSPVIIWQIMAFFLPALKPKEQRYVIPTFLAMVAFFALGVFFAYSQVLNVAFEWMVAQAGDTVQAVPDAAKYFGGATLLMIGFGIGFQLPVVVFYLVMFDIVPYAKLRANWRTAYVTLMVVASVATPDWSPVTMGALFAALLVLYEGSLLLARVALAKRIRQQKAMGY